MSTTFNLGNFNRDDGTFAPIRSYLAGLQLSNDGVTPNTVLDISAGMCADSTNATSITLGAVTKTTTGTWAAGSGSAGMSTGLAAANTWYHVFAILNGGSPDVCIDTSVTSTNAPAGTTVFRRIGSFKTDGSAHILGFNQLGDEFLWTTPVNEAAATNVSTSPSFLSLTAIPTGVRVLARLRASSASTVVGVAILFQSPDETPTNAGNPTGNADLFAPGTANNFGGANFIVRTNTSAQVRWSSDEPNTNSTYVASFGWFDRRGRDS